MRGNRADAAPPEEHALSRGLGSSAPPEGHALSRAPPLGAAARGPQGLALNCCGGPRSRLRGARPLAARGRGRDARAVSPEGQPGNRPGRDSYSGVEARALRPPGGGPQRRRPRITVLFGPPPGPYRAFACSSGGLQDHKGRAGSCSSGRASRYCPSGTGPSPAAPAASCPARWHPGPASRPACPPPRGSGRPRSPPPRGAGRRPWSGPGRAARWPAGARAAPPAPGDR